jgi:hypothetical protein
MAVKIAILNETMFLFHLYLQMQPVSQTRDMFKPTGLFELFDHKQVQIQRLMRKQGAQERIAWKHMSSHYYYVTHILSSYDRHDSLAHVVDSSQASQLIAQSIGILCIIHPIQSRFRDQGVPSIVS